MIRIYESRPECLILSSNKGFVVNTQYNFLSILSSKFKMATCNFEDEKRIKEAFKMVFSIFNLF